MYAINLDAIAAASPSQEPYRHFIGDHVLNTEITDKLLADFPVLKQTGFFPVGDLHVHGAFQDLVQDLHDPSFSALVGKKLDIDLTDKPLLITVRRWSATSDGRIHTDSVSKIATVLIYLNERWHDSGAGRLRVLRSDRNFEDYTTEISPTLGTVFGFKRADNSWHGHLPFAGERKVLQITWLTDASKVARKERSARISGWLKRFSRFGRTLSG